jgi:Cdc6-like AAA superfamily ATPase
MARFEDDFEFLSKGSGLIGRKEEKAEVVYRIASGNMLLIEGDKGVGKTALLKYAIDNFKGLGKVVYIDVGTFGKRVNIADLLSGRPKGMILLIDNIEYLSESNNKRIKYFYDQDDIKSVVFATGDSKAISFTPAIRSRIGRNVLKLEALSKGEVLKIGRDRLNEDVMISDKVLDELYKESKDLRRFLLNCDLLCNYLDREERDEAEVKDVAMVVVDNVVDNVVEGCLECNGELVEVGGKWRCENCDSYCEACGFLTEENECPACGEVEDE